MLTGKPLFPGKNVVHQLDLLTDLLGTPPTETISKIRNEKARKLMFSSHLTKSTAEKFKGQILQASEFVLGSSITIEIICESTKDVGSTVQQPSTLPATNDILSLELLWKVSIGFGDEQKCKVGARRKGKVEKLTLEEEKLNTEEKEIRTTKEEYKAIFRRRWTG
ncbi:hypothetical protein VNO80_07090 [Phaseolus coccineus]|uniref:STICHEL DnaA-N-like alpha-beta domain-containing protein n=1 Tax=Phaseolus coccineus TaxID=3886 RepID=A0AAN9NNG9_PHACN